MIFADGSYLCSERRLSDRPETWGNSGCPPLIGVELVQSRPTCILRLLHGAFSTDDASPLPWANGAVLRGSPSSDVCAGLSLARAGCMLVVSQNRMHRPRRCHLKSVLGLRWGSAWVFGRLGTDLFYPFGCAGATVVHDAMKHSQVPLRELHEISWAEEVGLPAHTPYDGGTPFLPLMQHSQEPYHLERGLMHSGRWSLSKPLGGRRPSSQARTPVDAQRTHILSCCNT